MFAAGRYAILGSTDEPINRDLKKRDRMANIIDDNINATNQSFLYFLHEENKFDKKSILNLCNYVQTLDSVTIRELRKLYFIQNQIIKHIAYHFDKNDMYEISNLPSDYWEYIELLDIAIDGLKDITI